MQKRGGRSDAVKGRICRHAAHGAETSGRSWQVAGVVNVQVYSAPLQERRWGAGTTNRCHENERMLVGGGVGWRRKTGKIQKNG